ncbi:arylamine N-acetyltransferase family protein [Aestuariispira ectoiniformans]|uniref:arylamine N-acetyltransferase family protein n=1 Tax=Aestuariispira ectoiniformans TaxID=2775080 RepID=UPI00223B751D|nr:arylamine N-acetyltransferase [Aestuariispira ectoiniformans]
MSERSISQVYLNALGLTADKPDLTFLTALQRAHLARYSFNSIGVLLGEDRPLDPCRLLQTIVAEGRGGYCFEHNGLFFEVLKELGFTVEAHLGRVLYNRNVEEPVMPRTHRMSVVTIGADRYVADVGFGVLTPREPVRLGDGETVHSDGESYRIRRNKVGDYLLEKQQKDGPFVLYSFDLHHTVPGDFEMGHFYSHRHPEAAFVNNLVVSRVLADERLVIRNHEVEVIRDGQAVTSPLLDKQDLVRRLHEDFNYRISEKDADFLFEKFCQPKKEP